MFEQGGTENYRAELGLGVPGLGFLRFSPCPPCPPAAAAGGGGWLEVTLVLRTISIFDLNPDRSAVLIEAGPLAKVLHLQFSDTR